MNNSNANIRELNARIQALLFENNDLKTNLSDLKTNLSGLNTTNELLSAKAEWLATELAISKHHCELLKKAIYGKRSEKTKNSYVEQMSLLFDEAEAYAQEADSSIDNKGDDSPQDEQKKKAGRKPLPANLPRVEVVHELKGEELECNCGGKLTHIGAEESEQLDIIPAKVIVKKHIRYKYACRDCEEVVKRAAAPFSPIKKTMATANLLAHICIQKFDDHSPLYRQERIWQRMGVSLSRATMANWMLAGATKLAPIVDLLKQDINDSDYVCSDETTLNVLSNDKSTNYMWLHMSGSREKRAVVYEYNQSRSGSVAGNFLSKFNGYHQCDGYAGYNELHDKAGVIGVGCMAHARRKFVDIVQITKKSGIASSIVDIIGKLYKVESSIKDLSPEQIYKARQDKAKPIMVELKQKLLHYQNQAPPTSILGKAINYPLNQWEKLTAYLENGRIRIDNNDCERAIKPFVIGRKNWLFSNSEKGAKASSIIFSIIETCKANNLNTYNYLRYIFENIHKATTEKDLRAILPYNIDPALLQT